MQTNNPLKDKRVALLGGIGARPEAKKKLIDELGLAELEWVYSEDNRTLNYEKFLTGLRPGKYDYIFLLVKFSSHIVVNKLKSADLFGTPLIKIHGSYNTQNFVNALFEQTDLEVVEEQEEEAPTQVIKKLLEPATPDTTERPRLVAEENLLGDDHELAEWHKHFGVVSPEVAKRRVDVRISALETTIKTLKANQQDPELLDAALGYHSAVTKYLTKLPVPFYVGEANKRLEKSLKKHGLEPDGGAGITITDKQKFESMVMRTNAILSDVVLGSIKLFKSQASDWVYNPRGACFSCKRHKSMGHAPDCAQHTFKQCIELLEKDLKQAGVDIPED